MAFYDNIPLHETTQRNHANVFNEPLEKIIANIKDNKQAIENLDLKADEIINMFDKYTETDDLNEMLKYGVKGDQGDPGASAYDLAVDSGSFVGTLNEWLESLKGEKGDKGDAGEVSQDQLDDAINELNDRICSEVETLEKSDIKLQNNIDSIYTISLLSESASQTHIKDGVETTITDWNDVKRRGLYMQTGASHNPTGDDTWYFVRVIVHNDTYLTQIAITFTDAIPKIYVRSLNNSIWTSWVKFVSEYDIPLFRKQGDKGGGINLELNDNSILSHFMSIDSYNNNMRFIGYPSSSVTNVKYIDFSDGISGKIATVNDTVAGATNADTVDGMHAKASYVDYNHIPVCGKDCPLEIGQWIDFHHSDGTDGVDFVSRLYINKGSETRGLYYTDYVDVSHSMNITQEILNLKSTSVNGKQTVANAINGVLGTSLSSSTSYDDMAYYISTMGGSSGGFADITTTACERVGTGTYTCRGISFYTSTDASICWSTPAVAKYIRFISGAYGANTTFRSYDTNPNINTYVSLNANGYACIIFDNTITVTINDVTTTGTEYVYILN